MDEPTPYESALELARKLAAVADPANGATPAEQETAATKLAALCESNGITPEALSPAARMEHDLYVISRYWDRDQPPRRDKKLAEFAMWCLYHVAGEFRPCRIIPTELEMPTRGLAVKMNQCFIIRAAVTDLEYREWSDFFEHYATYMIEHPAELRAAARMAAHASKVAVGTFCHVNKITLPPDAQAEPKRPGMKDLSAIFGTRAAPAFQRGGKLASSNLLS